MEAREVIHPLAREVVPVPDPERVWARALELPHPLLLESVPGGGAGGRYSFLAADPFSVVSVAPGAASDPFHALQAVLDRFPVETLAGLPPFQGGLAGYLGYELHRFVEPASRLPQRSHRHPDLWMGAYDWTVAWDHELGRCWILSTGLPESSAPERRRRAERRMAFVEGLLEAGSEVDGERRSLAGAASSLVGKRRAMSAVPRPAHPVPGFPGLDSTFSREGYLAAVDRVRTFIREGDVFQVNLSQRLSFECSEDPREVYHHIRGKHPAAFSAAIRAEGSWIFSASPERFLRVRGGEVETRPIKGTAARGKTPREDAELAEGLRASAKDRAENVMIVDLLRNDLSKVCADHTVEVTGLCVLESHPSVHHLVSTVRGRLREGVGVEELLRATFPGGSVTGAPKIRAVEIIGELEPIQRGVYTGSIGYLGFDGTVDLSVVIRTIVLEDRRAHLAVGGGILLDSDPEREYVETLDKAEGLLRALGAGGHTTGGS